ncbi:hypothetical protein [Lysobacter gummosus]
MPSTAPALPWSCSIFVTNSSKLVDPSKVLIGIATPNFRSM